MIPMLQPGFPALRRRQTYWAEQVFQPARPSDFHTAISKAQSHQTIMRAVMLGLTSLFDKQAQTQRRNGRELIYPPPLLYPPPLPYYYRPAVLKTTERFWTAGFAKRVPNPAKKGRENELITLVATDWPRMVTCWICEESSKSSEEGEREYV